MSIKNRDSSELITKEQLDQHVSYDKITGVMTWKVGFRSLSAGDVVSTVNTNGYLELNLFNKRYLAHRLAFLIETGSHPNEVDHIDGDRLNNRWENLRDVSSQENARNTKLNKRNKSGMPGVYRCPTSGRWVAEISVNGKQICIGRFDHRFFAKQARKAAELKYGYHENHGRRQSLHICNE